LFKQFEIAKEEEV